MEQKIRKIIASLEAQFTGDEEHDLGVVSKYLGSLERSVETAQIAKAIGHYCMYGVKIVHHHVFANDNQSCT